MCLGCTMEAQRQKDKYSYRDVNTSGIVPRYKSVRVHFQEQKKEQWSVIVNTTNLILPNLSFTNHNAHYILALHYIQTGKYNYT